MSDFFSGVQWRQMRVLVIVFIVSFLALALSFLLYYLTFDSLSSANRKLSAIENKIDTAVENGTVLFNGLTSLDEFYVRGILGEPLRLDWVETLQGIVAEYNIPKIGFSVNPTLTKGIDEYGVEMESDVLKTPMVLEMNLMHEGDFYQLLTELKYRSKSFFQVDFCELERVNKDLVDKSSAARLNATCELTWFNYRDLRQEWFGQDV